MATIPQHTFGTKCRLAPVPRPQDADGMPPIEAQFFYSSLIPIDDPLSTGSVVPGPDARASKGQIRPFSRGDNNTLEKAWLGLASEDDHRDHEKARTGRPRKSSSAGHGHEEGDKAVSDKRERLVLRLAQSHYEKHRSGFQPQDLAVPVVDSMPTTPAPACCSALLMDADEELQTSFCAQARKVDPSLSAEYVVQDVMNAITRLRQGAAKGTENATPERQRGGSVSGTGRPTSPPTPKVGKSPTDHFAEIHGRARSSSVATKSSRTETPTGSPAPNRPSANDAGITGRPFVRVETLEADNEARIAQGPRDDLNTTSPPPQGRNRSQSVQVKQGPDIDPRGFLDGIEEAEDPERSVEVAVGLSRLHKVSLPMLQMKPIYWSPVNDVAVVTRATWFYRDTMFPVSPAVANQLEAGYHDLRPWSETWGDEIRSALDVGPLGEEKVSHRLWPKDDKPARGVNTGLSDIFISSDPYCAAHCFDGEAAAEGSIEPLVPGVKAPETPARPFSNYHVIYKNDKEAYMLKPTLKPSAYYGRRPVLKITRGATVGIPVVRGFDREAWERAHHRNQTYNKPGASAASQSHESSGHDVCPACKADKDRGQVSDLVLVAHGIGQKFAERVESFHFTHAINAFRRSINIELGNPIVQQVLRSDQNGLMILPLNWRLGLSFEDGGPMRDEDKDEEPTDSFALKDIEPDTIPAIRSMISDVMFDIPFYMSHHKGKMIQAMVSEANRVYRLWCRNNPGFAENGRVHLIGHSLGSAMALEVLSRQPTIAPPMDLSRKEPETRFFEFDTRNLFLVGSPAGFFLLLERGALLPRRGRHKPGADRSDTLAQSIGGEPGRFGCLAVDNIYNVLAKEDPIAYFLNGAVDATYATSLKTAYVPSATPSLFKSMGDAMRTVVPGMGPAPNPLALAPEVERPSAQRLPSQLELEVHDFTREEIAEKKAYLLNDNGQIDWFLKSGGGPLELQYLNMLSAHTSYWTNLDFIRMVCMEIGRKPGRSNTIPAFRAVKATKRMIPRASS